VKRRRRQVIDKEKEIREFVPESLEVAATASEIDETPASEPVPLQQFGSPQQAETPEKKTEIARHPWKKLIQWTGSCLRKRLKQLCLKQCKKPTRKSYQAETWMDFSVCLIR
jgi:hypothetical protein